MYSQMLKTFEPFPYKRSLLRDSDMALMVRLLKRIAI